MRMTISRIVQAARNLVGRKRFALGLDILLALCAQFILLVIILHGRDLWPVLRMILATGAVGGVALYLFKAHRQLWTRVSLRDVVALTYAALLTSFIIAIFSLFDFGERAPVRVGIGTIFVLLAGWVGPRMLARLWWESRTSDAVHRPEDQREPILLFGSGRRAIQFIKANSIDQRYHIAGFFHDDPRVRGRQLLGVPGLGMLTGLGEILEQLHEANIYPRRLVVTEDGEGGDDLARGLDHAAKHGMILCRLPSAIRLVSADTASDRVQLVSIEDILHRDTVSLNSPKVPLALRETVVLVTGAGGSIGSELVRQIATYDPAKIVLLEFSEFNLYEVDHELAERFPHVPRATALCDIRQYDAVERVFLEHRPTIVLHAAALKHVPLLESHVSEAVLTNVLGTLNLAKLALEYDIKQFTLVSTDKAVNPTNAMGCTKRWAEMICQSINVEAEKLGKSTRFACVRFGNVLGSAGSVVPLFRRQIAQGGPITVTDPEITRYFMTIPEACELILTATATTMASAGRDSRVFVLDMGQPVRILDLAERMAQLHGLRPHIDIAISITGLRAGEKLHEELAHPDENLVPASFPRASLANARAPDFDVVARQAGILVAAAKSGKAAAVRDVLVSLVPEHGWVPAVSAPMQQLAC